MVDAREDVRQTGRTSHESRTGKPSSDTRFDGMSKQIVVRGFD